MVSTNGNGPKLAALIREKVAESLPPNTGDAIVKVGELRKKLRKLAPGTEQGGKRMKWMSRVCEEWTFTQLAGLTVAQMDILLEGYKGGKVGTWEEVSGKAKLLEAVKDGEDEDDKKEGEAS